MKTLYYTAVLFLGVLVGTGCKAAPTHVHTAPDVETLRKAYDDNVGPPHIERVTPDILVAVGYDLANVILVRTPEGNVIVDTAMTPGRAAAIKEALLREAPGPTRAVIFTHSHIDHVGGAAVWVEKDTPIWATDNFTGHFLKQYALFAPAEQARGRRQFGDHVRRDLLPCSGLGPCVDFDGLRHPGIRMPNHTFSGKASFTVGGVEFDLVEAHGETHDMLFVWIPSAKTLLCGDNFYRAFPNLYTIRGTTARPVDQWIESLDAMRALAPEHLVPSHTKPLSGQEIIRAALTDYRDAIQWVRDQTVRGANAGVPLDELAASVTLPDHLARSPYLREIYGEVDWSVRGIYDSNLGWFDGRPEALYPLPPKDLARKEIAMMGGAAAVRDAARKAMGRGDVRWAVHLLSRLGESGLLHGKEEAARAGDTARAYEELASRVGNPNGKGYLYESAYELTHTIPTPPRPVLDDALLRHVPLKAVFHVMAVRLDPAKAMDTEESLRWVFPDEKTAVTVTVRHGVAEVVEGEPLPGTPPPLSVITVDGLTWKKIAVGRETPVRALASGALTVKGSRLGTLRFLSRFTRGL